jgi:enoyl-CoA hydratase/carnithine racemase
LARKNNKKKNMSAGKLTKLNTCELEERSDGVAIVYLSRESRGNAFTSEMGSEVAQLMDTCSRADSIKAVILTGRGSDSFCRGVDLLGPDFASLESADENGRARVGLGGASVHRDTGGMMSMAVLYCRKPVIAAVNGSAVGIGATLILAADVRVAKSSAKLGFVFARRGIVNEACSSVLLQRVVGRGKAMEWLLSGRVFEAREERESGLFNYVVDGDPMHKAVELAEEIARNCSSYSNALIKQLMIGGMTSTVEQAHLDESRVLHSVFVAKNDDFVEGVSSFFDKRKPNFSMSPWRDMPDCYPWVGQTTLSPLRIQASL